jgi:hypothetical protein
MRRRTTGGAVVVAISLSVFAYAQEGKPVYIRDNDGRLVQAARVLNPGDVPPKSALYGITVVDSAEGNSAVVSATSRGSLLQVGDRIDEVQLAGMKDRERNVNPGYFKYQVWTVSDFYRLAAQCVETCLVRLRTLENMKYNYVRADGGAQTTLVGPRSFAYLPVGTGAGFGQELDETSGGVAKYVDLRTGERFGPPASVVFGR